MKRIYLFLSLTLILLVSASWAWASLMPGSDAIVDVKDGDTFFIRGEWLNGNSGNYLDTYRWLGVQYPKVGDEDKLIVSETVSVGDTYAFTTEAAGTTINGQAAFYLKNTSTGLYVARDKTEGSNKVSSLYLTKNRDEACPWIFLHANAKYDTAPEEAIQLVTLANDGTTLLYFNNNYDGNNGIYAARVATWTDGTTWHTLVKAEENEDEEGALIEDILSIYRQIENYYPATGGNEPGYYSQAVADEFNKAYVECNIDDIFGKADYDIQMLRDAKARMEAIAAEILKGPQTVADKGYYYLISAKEWTVNPEDERAIYAEDGGAYWNTIQRGNANYIWQFFLQEDGTYLMQNLGSGQYITANDKSGKCAMGNTPGKTMTMRLLGSAQFQIIYGTNRENALHCNSHNNGAGTAGHITGWDEGLGSPSAWYFQTVPQEVIDALMADVEKEREALAAHDALAAFVSEVRNGTKAAFEYEIPADAKDVTPLSGEDFESNAAMSAEHGYSWGNDGQGYAALIDGNLDTYFHTDWNNHLITSTTYDAEGNPTGTYTTLHNLGMKLAAPVSNVAFQVSARRGNYNNPCKIDVEVSKDGQTWTTIFYGYDFFTPSKNADQPYIMGPFELGGEYEYVRFANYINDRSSEKFFCFSELKVYEGVKLTSSCQASTIDAAIVSEFLNAYSAANKYVGVYTADDIEAMKVAQANLAVAYDHFKGVFADPTELNDALASATKLINNMKLGEGQVGLYPNDIDLTELEAAMADGSDLINAGNYTQAALAGATEAIQNAQAAIEARVIGVDTNKWYKFQYASEEEYVEQNYNGSDGLIDRVACVAQGCDTQGFMQFYEDITTLRESSRLYSARPDTVPDADLYSFRFVAVGDEGYAIQNKATGLWISELPWSSMVRLSSKPGLFKVATLGAGFCVIESYNLYTGEGREGGVNTLHFANTDQWCEMRGWPDHQLATKSALKIIEMDGEVVEDEIGLVRRDITEGEAYVATFNANLTSIEGVEAYTVAGEYTDEDGICQVGLNIIDEVKAGQPVVLLAVANVASFRFGSNVTAEALTENGLVGALQALTVEGIYAVLQNTEEGKSWKMMSGTSNIPAGEGYLSDALPVLTSEEFASTNLSILLTQTLTGIKSVVSTTGKVLPVYDLQGHRVANTNNLNGLRTGIYVVGGKKVVIK